MTLSSFGSDMILRIRMSSLASSSGLYLRLDRRICASRDASRIGYGSESVVDPVTEIPDSFQASMPDALVLA